jgi:hypothetical protein
LFDSLDIDEPSITPEADICQAIGHGINTDIGYTREEYHFPRVHLLIKDIFFTVRSM